MKKSFLPSLICIFCLSALVSCSKETKAPTKKTADKTAAVSESATTSTPGGGCGGHSGSSGNGGF